MKTKKNKSAARIRKTGIDGGKQSKLESALWFKVSPFRPRLQNTAAFLLLTILILPNLGCESPSLKANSSKPAADVAEDNRSGFEKDLQTMRNADFDFVYVFRRKDGGALDGEDKKYLKANSPYSTNRFILTDENKAVIAGSSYKFEPENLENLQKRFVIENFSKPESRETPGNLNSN